MDLLNRYRGCLFGLAAGDALGTTLEFTPPLDPFRPRVTKIVGGGPFGLPPGGWTDDTTMALCLAESLVAHQGLNATDQMQRYLRWMRAGYNSVLDRCFDIGGATRAAISHFAATGNPWAGAPDAAGNGSLMRLAPAVLAARSEEQALHYAREQGRTTHGAPQAIDACVAFARLLWRALHGASKDELLDPALFAHETLHPEIAAVMAGSYRTKMPPAISGAGYVVQALEAALWSFYHGSDFSTTVVLAANLGEDADTTAATAGQIAGAYGGFDDIPATWRATVLRGDQIIGLADQLYALATAP